MSDNKAEEAVEAPRRSPDIYTQIDQHGEMLDSEIQDLERMGVLLAEKSKTNATSNNIMTDSTTQHAQQRRRMPTPPPQIMGNNSNNNNEQLKSSIKAVDKSSSSTQGTSPSTTDEEQHNNSSMTNVNVCDNNTALCSNGAIIDNATTKSSSSSNNDVNEQHSPIIDHHQYEQIINNNSSTSSIHEQLYTNLINNLLNLHTSIQQSIQFSYMEQDHLFHDITTMTNRISYLQRQISLAREELIELGGDDMGDKLMRLSLVKEVENICDSRSSRSSEDDNDVEEEDDDANNTFEVTYESFKPDNNENTQQQSRRRRGSLSKRRGSIQGSQTSGLSNTSHDTGVSQASGTSSIFRITFGGVDGMPSRWRAREEERERVEEERAAAAAAALLNGSNKTTSSTSSANNERGCGKNNNTKEQQLNTLTQLVCDRETDITHLEKEMIIIDREKSSLENEVAVLKTNITKSQSTTRNEKQKLMGVLDVCLLDNSRLGKELLETSVSLDERKMNVTLLGNELRTARERFCNVRTKKEKERKEQRRKREQQQQHQQQHQHQQSVGNGKVSQFDYRSTSTKDGQSSSSNNKVVRYEVPTNAMDAYQTQQDAIITDEQQQQQRNSGSLRTSRDPSLSSSGKSEGGGSRATVMSALTMDSSDLVDVLEGLGVGDLT